MFKSQEIAAMNIFKSSIGKLFIVLQTFRATWNSYDLQAEGQFFSQICHKQQRELGHVHVLTHFFFLLCSHSPEIKLLGGVLLKILNSQYAEAMITYITECCCME